MIVVHAVIVVLIVAIGGTGVFIASALILDIDDPRDSVALPIVIYALAVAAILIGASL